MASLVQIESADRQLLAGIAASMDDAARRSGDWIACRIGCTQCCVGPFAISQLDALRLRQGMAALEAADPERAAAVRERATGYIREIAPVYPGEFFDDDNLPPSMDELVCPALDPLTGACDVYAARPITCRSFGPATRIGENRLAACELCYDSATDEEMEACAVEVDPEGVELKLVEALEAAGLKGTTIVAYALISARNDVY
jgi:Fe-S-cluster containining protein